MLEELGATGRLILGLALGYGLGQIGCLVYFEWSDRREEKRRVVAMKLEDQTQGLKAAARSTEVSPGHLSEYLQGELLKHALEKGGGSR